MKMNPIGPWLMTMANPLSDCAMNLSETGDLRRGTKLLRIANDLRGLGLEMKHEIGSQQITEDPG